jgi:rubredoxin
MLLKCEFYFIRVIKSLVKGVVVELKTWMCLICGWVYEEEKGSPEDGIAPGTRWEDVPMNWTCPECGARKDDFDMMAI